MKAGIVQALFALEALHEAQAMVSKRIVFLWTSDEEIGSESSRVLIESEARRSDAVFVLEPSLGPRGLVKLPARASARPKSLFMAAPRMPAWPRKKASTPFMSSPRKSPASKSGTIIAVASP